MFHATYSVNSRKAFSETWILPNVASNVPDELAPVLNVNDYIRIRGYDQKCWQQKCKDHLLLNSVNEMKNSSFPHLHFTYFNLLSIVVVELWHYFAS